MTQVSLWLSGGRTVSGQWWLDLLQPSSDQEMQNQEDYWENWGAFQQKSSTNIFPAHNQMGAWFAVFLMLPLVQFSRLIYCISLPALVLILRGYLAATKGFRVRAS